MPTIDLSDHPDSICHDSAHHRPFSWLEPDAFVYPSAHFTALGFDVSRRLRTCLELVNASQLDRATNENTSAENDSLPVLNIGDTESLLRMSIATSQMLSDAAERELYRVNTGG